MMDDPLGTSPFASSPALPAWPSTPHTPNSPQPTLPRPASPLPPSQIVGPYGKEPQIYGQPTPGLISPQVTTAANGSKFERDGQYLRVRITGLDRNRRDIIIRIDAQTNLPNFTGSTYRNISRSYVEFQRFAEQIAYCNPQTIVPALPLPQTSAPSDEEDDRLVKVMLQRWFSRVCEDPILIQEDEVRSFIESDFGYQPTPRPRRKTGSGFSLIKRSVPDEDEELMSARLELTRLEVQFFDAAKAVDRLSKARKALSAAHAELGNKLINVATTEVHPPLGAAIRKSGRVWHSISDVDQAQALSECVIIGDALGYQGMNAKAAKETLQHRTQVLEDYQSAVKATIAKRRNIERLKASSNIRPDKVDEALEDMEEANKVEQLYQRRVEGISENLHNALRTHARHAHEDITHTLIEHARASIHYGRGRLRELETLRPDIARAAGPAQSVPASNGRGAVPPPLRGPLIQPPLGPNSAPSSAPPSPRVQVNRPPMQQPQPSPYAAPALASPHLHPSSAGPSTPVPGPANAGVDPLAGIPRPQSATPSHVHSPLPTQPPLVPPGSSNSSIPGTPVSSQAAVHPLAKSIMLVPESILGRRPGSMIGDSAFAVYHKAASIQTPYSASTGICPQTVWGHPTFKRQERQEDRHEAHMAASRINLRGSKRAGSEIYEGESVAGPSELNTSTSGERPSKKSKQAERRLCPLCNKLIPLHMLTQHTEMELAKVNEVIQDEGSGEAGPSDPTASNNRRSAALRARASLIALAPTRRNTHPNLPTTASPQANHNPNSPSSERAARQNRRTRNSIGAGTDSMVERRRRRVGGVCPVCEDDIAEDLEEHVDRCLQEAVLPHRSHAPDTDEPSLRSREEPVEGRVEELVRVTDYTDFRGTGFDIRDRNVPDVDDELDIDGDEDTVLYGESQFFEGDIIAQDEEDGTEDSAQHPRSTPGSEDNEPGTRSLRDLVATRKMVLTLREVDIEGEEEDEQVSVGSSVHMAMASPAVDLSAPYNTLDGKDAQISSLMAKIQELEASLHRQAAKANTLTPPTPYAKENSAASADDASPTVCRICLDAFVEPVVSTGCWHLFCRECWLQSLGSTKYCPICKRITSTSNLRKVYL